MIFVCRTITFIAFKFLPPPPTQMEFLHSIFNLSETFAASFERSRRALLRDHRVLLDWEPERWWSAVVADQSQGTQHTCPLRGRGGPITGNTTHMSKVVERGGGGWPPSAYGFCTSVLFSIDVIRIYIILRLRSKSNYVHYSALYSLLESTVELQKHITLKLM